MNKHVSQLPHSDLTVVVLEGVGEGIKEGKRKKRENAVQFLGYLILSNSLLTFRQFLSIWHISHSPVPLTNFYSFHSFSQTPELLRSFWFLDLLYHDTQHLKLLTESSCLLNYSKLHEERDGICQFHPCRCS